MQVLRRISQIFKLVSTEPDAKNSPYGCHCTQGAHAGLRFRCTADVWMRKRQRYGAQPFVGCTHPHLNADAVGAMACKRAGNLGLIQIPQLQRATG